MPWRSPSSSQHSKSSSIGCWGFSVNESILGVPIERKFVICSSCLITTLSSLLAQKLELMKKNERVFAKIVEN